MSRQLFKTESFTEKYRNDKHNGVRNFTKCEHCGYEDRGAESLVSNVYRHRYKKILCDRCTDNFDGVTVWNDENAREKGLSPFPDRKGF